MDGDHAKPDPARRGRLRAWRRLALTIRDGGERYERWRALPRLVPVAFPEISDPSRETALALIARIEAAIARERRRLRAGHWAYDVNRHIALLQAWRGERQALEPERGNPTRCARVDQAQAATGCKARSGAEIDARPIALLTGTKAS